MPQLGVAAVGGALAAGEPLQVVLSQAAEALSSAESIMNEIAGRMHGTNDAKVTAPPISGNIVGQAHDIRSKACRVQQAAQALLELL